MRGVRIDGAGPNPSGLCMCGCGKRTPLAVQGDASRGNVAGKPVRFARGHWANIQDHGLDYMIDPGTGCWVWLKAVDDQGYGSKLKGKAHRHYYEKHIGPIPQGLQLDHLCRNRACVNPAHLEPVTPAENTRRSSVAKLGWATVELIRARPDATEVELAERFGVSERAIRHVRNRTRWVPDEEAGRIAEDYRSAA
jgi:hypothetical protein